MTNIVFFSKIEIVFNASESMFNGFLSSILIQEASDFELDSFSLLNFLPTILTGSRKTISDDSYDSILKSLCEILKQGSESRNYQLISIVLVLISKFAPETQNRANSTQLLPLLTSVLTLLTDKVLF